MDPSFSTASSVEAVEGTIDSSCSESAHLLYEPQKMNSSFSTASLSKAVKETTGSTVALECTLVFSGKNELFVLDGIFSRNSQ